MARRKDQGSQGQAVVVETSTEEMPGETHIHRTVREWHPHAPERLSEIEAIIDSWGRRSTEGTPRLRELPPDELQARVDKVTKRVKGSRKVVVQETVTEWVERPVEETEPEPEPEPETTTEAAVEETVLAHQRAASASSRPKRGFLGFIGKKSPRVDRPAKTKKFKLVKGKKPATDTSEPDYQPQCAALTEDGSQCRNSARGVSRYCSSHKGYQPPTAKGLAKRIEGDAWDPKDDVTDHQSVKGADTRPVVRKAKDTKVKVRKAAKRSSKAAKASKKGGRRKR
jgi:hypothetical protein